MNDEKDIPLVPRSGYRAEDDGIGYLSAHPVSVSIKGPCHEQEGNDKCGIENCQLKMFDEVGDDILSNDDYTSGASDLDLTDSSSEDEDGIQGVRIRRIVKTFEKMRRVRRRSLPMAHELSDSEGPPGFNFKLRRQVPSIGRARV